MEGVTAIIPNYNRRALLEKTLGDLARQTHPPAEIVVVDNASGDGSAEAAEAAGAHVIRLERNAGFSVAVNRGVRESRTAWVAVLNNDLELDAHWLERLLSRATAAGAWFAAGKILRAGSRDILDATFDALCRGGCSWRCGEGRSDTSAWSVEHSIRFAPLTATLLRRELFERVGGLEERFESYLEDIEFGLRCALAGCEGLYVPDAIAYHLGSATLGRWHPETVRLMARNQLLLVAKHYPAGWVLTYGWEVLVAQLLWGMLALRHGTGVAWLAGKRDGLRQFRGMRAGAASPERLRGILDSSESEILELQRRSGFDWYWRMYFALT